MVKKLFKHEILSYMRQLLPAECVMLGIALLVRLVQFAETDKSWYEVVFTSFVVALVVAVLVCLINVVVTVIKRFYTNMFTHEGYLTLTLPVTPFQHITVKALIGALAVIETLFVCFIGLCVSTFGEVMVELFRAAGYYITSFIDMCAKLGYGAHIAPWIIEAVLLMLISLVSTILFYYLCISVGQLSHKNRVAASFGFFFLVYFGVQILFTIFMVILAITDFELFDDIAAFFEDHQVAGIHIILGGGAALYAAFGALFFFISHKIINTKLNIE